MMPGRTYVLKTLQTLETLLPNKGENRKNSPNGQARESLDGISSDKPCLRKPS